MERGCQRSDWPSHKDEPEHMNYFESQRAVREALNVQPGLLCAMERACTKCRTPLPRHNTLRCPCHKSKFYYCGTGCQRLHWSYHKHEPEHMNYFEWQRTVREALNVQAELPTRATVLVKEFLDRTW